jgi:hypothetical protein
MGQRDSINNLDKQEKKNQVNILLWVILSRGSRSSAWGWSRETPSTTWTSRRKRTRWIYYCESSWAENPGVQPEDGPEGLQQQSGQAGEKSQVNILLWVIWSRGSRSSAWGWSRGTPATIWTSRRKGTRWIHCCESSGAEDPGVQPEDGPEGLQQQPGQPGEKEPGE